MHGVCFGGQCFCEEGFAGLNCAKTVESLDDGVKLIQVGIPVTISVVVIGLIIGCVFMVKLVKKVNMQREGRVLDLYDEG
jgi:hypothetical protein|mmetsp:Transcript_2011/g.251  ORF Transcript_2011/g.251 Transcript_2011/m.251 type:complete len:80 (-) Transcript_2011:30-269(-)